MRDGQPPSVAGSEKPKYLPGDQADGFAVLGLLQTPPQAVSPSSRTPARGAPRTRTQARLLGVGGRGETRRASRTSTAGESWGRHCGTRQGLGQHRARSLVRRRVQLGARGREERGNQAPSSAKNTSHTADGVRSAVK